LDGPAAKPVKAGDAKLEGLMNTLFNACQLPYPKGSVIVTRMTGTLNLFQECEMRKAILVMLLAVSSSLATAEQMVWKVVSSGGIVSATVYNDLKVCKKALPRYAKGSSCLAVPANKG
jgi:hypothetical protein